MLILADDLGWTDLGCAGSDYYETPRIDRLADEGLLFTNAYMCAANCAPSRAAIMSGQYAPRTGVYTVSPAARGRSENRRLIPIANNPTLAPAVITVAEALRGAGYRTGHFGKWHLGADPETGPLAQGFDVNVAGSRRGHPSSYFSPYGNGDIADGPEGENLTLRLAEEASSFIRVGGGEPFFLYLPFYAVHTPIQPEPERLEHFRAKPTGARHTRPGYAAMIATMDEAVGRVLDALEESGLAGNTVVFFTSDNGGNGRITNNAPLRGAKGMFYEGGIRVPFIVRWPGRIDPGARCDVPVTGIDFLPTLLEIAGIDPPAQPLDGVSLLPVLTGAPSLHRTAIYWHFPAYLESSGVVPGPWRTTPVGAIRAGRYKLLEFFEDGRLELYDLEQDESESHDLGAQMPEKRDELHAMLKAWRAGIGAPVPIEPNPGYRGG